MYLKWERTNVNHGITLVVFKPKGNESSYCKCLACHELNVTSKQCFMVLYNAPFFPMQLYKTIVTTNVGSL